MFQIINEWLHNCAIMGYKCDLTASEKSVVTSELSKGKSTLEKLSSRIWTIYKNLQYILQ